MLSHANLRYHKAAIDIIQGWQKKTGGILKKNGAALDGTRIKLQPGRKGYEFTFRYNIFSPKTRKIDVGKQYKKMVFTAHGKSFVFERLYIATQTIGQMTGDVDFFHTLGYLKSSAFSYSLIIPLTKEISFTSTLEQTSFSTDLGFRMRNGTRAVINEDELLVSVIHDSNSKYYLVIESQRVQSYGSFSDKAFAVKNAIGYLTGHLAGDKGYFFAYNKNNPSVPVHYYFCVFRNTIKSGYTPVCSNPHAYLHDKKKLAEKYKKSQLLREVNQSEFTILSQRLHDSLPFSTAILLLLESSVASLLFMPGGMAIVLESLSDILMGEDQEKLKPVKDKKTAAAIRAGCTAVIEAHGAGLATEDKKVLVGRIEQINQVTNKARLRAPFKKLGIILLDEDLQVLESRNDFLHGRLPDFTGTGTIHPDRNSRDLYYASMRFYTLINMLVLKWIGYDNYVLNHPQLQEAICQMKGKEAPYRKIG